MMNLPVKRFGTQFQKVKNLNNAQMLMKRKTKVKDEGDGEKDISLSQAPENVDQLHHLLHSDPEACQQQPHLPHSSLATIEQEIVMFVDMDISYFADILPR